MGLHVPHKTVVLVFGLPLSTPDRMETTLASGEFEGQECYVYSGYPSTEAFQGVTLEPCSRELPRLHALGDLSQQHPFGDNKTVRKLSGSRAIAIVFH